MLLLLTILNILSPSAFAAEEDDADAVVRIVCDCYIGNSNVGSAESTSASTSRSDWQRQVTPECKRKYGSQAKASSCESGN